MNTNTKTDYLILVRTLIDVAIALWFCWYFYTACLSHSNLTVFLIRCFPFYTGPEKQINFILCHIYCIYIHREREREFSQSQSKSAWTTEWGEWMNNWMNELTSSWFSSNLAPHSRALFLRKYNSPGHHFIRKFWMWCLTVGSGERPLVIAPAFLLITPVFYVSSYVTAMLALNRTAEDSVEQNVTPEHQDPHPPLLSPLCSPLTQSQWRLLKKFSGGAIFLIMIKATHSLGTLS